MIVPMKKAAVIAQSKDAEGVVRSLRSLGVLHVEHQVSPAGPDIASLREDITLASDAIGILLSPGLVARPRVRLFSRHRTPRHGGKAAPLWTEHAADWRVAARHVIDSWKRLDQLEEYSRHLKASIDEWTRWGDFNPDEITGLASKGIHIRLYEIPVSELKSLPEGAIVKTIFVSAGMAGCVVVSRLKDGVPFREITPPKLSLQVMKERLNEEAAAIIMIKENLAHHLTCLEMFTEARKKLERDLEFRQALDGMGKDGGISYITGYLPADSTDALIEKSKEERWALAITDVSDSDDVPILIRSPRWVSTIKPIFRLLEILPGYHELDISPLFLIFLGLFFGMIIGDAGYGTIYMLLTFIADKKMGSKIKDRTAVRLFYFFSSCAILWGVVTGTIFGQEWYIKSGMRPIIPILNDTKFIQAFCFFLGAFHLTLGHAWQAIRKAPSAIALADVGWIAVLWSAFFFAKTLILSDPLPRPVMPILYTGIALVILFSSPNKNILKTIASGFGTVLLSIMNNFTDVVSYIRLFAVGLAGVAISDTVNTLASVFGGDDILVRTVIVFLGHTLNIVLGPLSVLVHGVRLNVLEFSGHASLTWSGRPYRPLRDSAD